MLHAVHPALGHVNASQIICSAGHQNACFGAGQDKAALKRVKKHCEVKLKLNAWFGAPPLHTASTTQVTPAHPIFEARKCDHLKNPVCKYYVYYKPSHTYLVMCG